MGRILPLCLILALLSGCVTSRKASRIGETSPRLDLVSEDRLPELGKFQLPTARDTITVKDEKGRDVLIMKAVRDEDGEMVATDVIDAAVVTARFSNVAERMGKVDICFNVTVPKAMQDSKWQIRFYPIMSAMGEDIPLDPVIITGNEYRKSQLRGYQQYSRFLESISADSTKFVNISQLELFLKRNIPQLYRFKTDSSFVSDEEFASAYGVSEKTAVEHYTNRFAVRKNLRKIGRKEQMFRKWVKSPIGDGKVRIDTVMRTSDNDFVYAYSTEIQAVAGLRKVQVTMTGEIFDYDKKIYSIPQSDSLTFYISSLSSFAEDRERYIVKVLERRVEANTACYIDFSSGSHAIDGNYGYNRSEIRRIQENLAQLLENRDFDMDSIVVTASCSPEGAYDFNRKLSQRRSESVSKYFRDYISSYRDSLKREGGFAVDFTGESSVSAPSEIAFLSKSNAENWDMLDALVASDTVLTASEKDAYRQIGLKKEPDLRERGLQGEPYYLYLREKLYPRLRTVKFDFHLHRKGMVKDTVHSTVADTVYSRGVLALRERRYKEAIETLRPYRDFNTAVAYSAMNYDASALDILEELPGSDKVNYLLAILYSRRGDEQKAVQCYLDACNSNRSYVSRGNLDPEISALIKKYSLNHNHLNQ